MQKRVLARILILATLIGLAWFVWHRQQQQQVFQAEPGPVPTTQNGAGNTQNNSQAPAYVLKTLQYIRDNGQAPDGFVGGREFQNREKKLPAKAADGKRIRYSEWDVHPKNKGKNRGPERLVTGSDHSAYYTKDHYKNFLRLDR